VGKEIVCISRNCSLPCSQGSAIARCYKPEDSWDETQRAGILKKPYGLIFAVEGFTASHNRKE
jgi:hypothetical protein